MLPASLVDPWVVLTPSTSFISIGEASKTRDPSTQWTGTGLKKTHISRYIVNGLIYNFSYDGELHLVHYKSTYDNISSAIADNQTDSLAVVGIFLREATTWDQWRGGQDADSINNLKAGALGLSRNWRGPTAPILDVELVLDQFVSSIT